MVDYMFSLPMALIILSILAVWHFVYESILLPANRLHLRNRLFMVRDELRRLKIDGQVSEDDQKVYDNIHEGINVFLGKMPQVTFSAVVSLVVAKNHDENLKRRLESRRLEIANCKNEKIKAVSEKTNSILFDALLYNSGGWFMYIVPIAVCVACVQSVKKIFSESLVAPRYIQDQYFVSDACAA
jgi:hypothetical protein